MEYIENKDLVLIFDKHIGLDTLASKLALLSGDQTRTFFLGREIKIPRRINAMALTSALNERIKTLDSHSLTRDGFLKLENYATFTEFQLQNLFDKICNAEDFFLYRKNLWKILIMNHVGIKLQDGEVVRLINLRKSKVDTFQNYSKAIFAVTLDIAKEFDGCPLSELEFRLRQNFSLEEIRLLGEKYDFHISNRLKKDELLDYVKMMMKSKRKLTLALGRELSNMTLTQLNEFCNLQGLGISSTLKKDEMVTLLLFLVKIAGYTTIDAKQIHGSHFTEPLKFRIDLDAVDNFKRGYPKKVIYLDEEEIKSFDQLDEYVAEAMVTTNSKDDMIFEILKKLMPYMNVDAETAKVAISKGISIPELEPQPEPKKKTTKTKKVIVEVPKIDSGKELAMAKQEIKDEILEEVIKKVNSLREKDKLEEEKAKLVQKQVRQDEDIEELISMLDDSEEYDHLDFEPEEDEIPQPTLSPLEEFMKNHREEVMQKVEVHNPTPTPTPVTNESLDLDYDDVESLSSELDEVVELDYSVQTEESTQVLEENVSIEEEKKDVELELQNESYDEEFLKEEGIESAEPTKEEEALEDTANALVPVEPVVDLTAEAIPTDSEFTPISNPYYGSKKMNFKKKAVVVRSLTIGMILVLVISIMAVIYVFK